MIRILVDASADISEAECREAGWFRVPISVELDGVEYEDRPVGDFYRAMESTTAFPHTSQPTPNAFLAPFEEVRDAGDELICLTLSSALSGTYQNALFAAESVGYPGIHVIDSRHSTHAIRLLVEYADRLIKEGVEAPEIVRRVERLRPRVRILAGLETMAYLARGGRIPKAVAMMGDAVRIRPVITFSQRGEVELLGKAMGTGKALSQVTRLIAARGVDPEHNAYEIYTTTQANVQRLAERLERRDIVATGRRQVGPTIGSHIGPDAYGMVFVSL